MPSIVLTDPLPFTETDLSRLRALGPVTVATTMPASEEALLDRLRGHEVAVVGWCNLPGRVLDAASDLRFVSLWAAGSDHVDLVTARRRNILVASAADYAEVSVAEFTIGAILSLLRHVPQAARGLREGVRDWRPFQGHDLNGRTVGVVGSGAIGRRVIKLLQAFGAKVVCHTRRPSVERAAELGVEFATLDALVAAADVITLHVPLTEGTRNLFDRPRLMSTKPGTILVNTARGPVVDEVAVFELLRDGHLGGAALDVFAQEPPNPPAEWLEQPNLMLTPHIAFNTAEALALKTEICVANVEAFVNGNPQNLVG